MLPYQKRVVAERADLFDNLTKLLAFTKSPDFFVLPKNDQRLLWQQEAAMSTYLRILDERIETFT